MDADAIVDHVDDEEVLLDVGIDPDAGPDLRPVRSVQVLDPPLGNRFVHHSDRIVERHATVYVRLYYGAFADGLLGANDVNDVLDPVDDASQPLEPKKPVLARVGLLGAGIGS